jgi:hypothetical protein
MSNTSMIKIPARVEDLNVDFDVADVGDGLVFNGSGWARLVDAQGTIHSVGAETITGPKLVHRAQPITSGFDNDVAWTISSTRADGTDPGMDPGFPAPVGNIALGIRNPARENTPYRWPWYVADDGAMAMGQAFTVSQMRRVDGSIIGCYGPGSIDIRPDGNWSCIRVENSMHNLISPNPNAYCIGFLNRDSGDVRDAANNGPYSVACGLLQGAQGPSMECWWGTSLLEDPDANRLAKLWLHTSTNHLTFEGSLTGTTTTVDIWRPSVPGTGAAEFGMGRRASGEADLLIRALSGVDASATVTFAISTPSAVVTGITMTPRIVDGSHQAICEIPFLDLTSGINLVDASGVARATWGNSGNRTMLGTLTIPGMVFSETNPAGDGLAPQVVLGDASPTVAALYVRKVGTQSFLYGNNAADAGGVTYQGAGGFTLRGTNTAGATNVFVSNTAAFGTANSARVVLAPHNGYGVGNGPYIEGYNVPGDPSTGVDGGVRIGTYFGGLGVRFDIKPDGSLAHSGPKAGFLGAPEVVRQTGGAATAGGTYDATAQGMLQKVYDALRAFGFLT